MPLVWIVLVILIFFGAYSVAPIFGLDEVYPDLLGAGGPIGRGVLIALMLAGGVFWLIDRRRRRRDD